jgi:hypothetical protein
MAILGKLPVRLNEEQRRALQRPETSVAWNYLLRPKSLHWRTDGTMEQKGGLIPDGSNT